MVVDRVDSRAGEVRRGRGCVGAGARLAGLCRARRTRSRSTAARLAERPAMDGRAGGSGASAVAPWTATRRPSAMKLESLRVELRPRSPWEAVELGSALVRRNAAAIWVPWLLLVGPVFVAVNLAAIASDRIGMAWRAKWWEEG